MGMVVLPFVSLVAEKEEQLRLVVPRGLYRIESYHRDSSHRLTTQRLARSREDEKKHFGPPVVDIAVCTIEKANALIDFLLAYDDKPNTCAVAASGLQDAIPPGELLRRRLGCVVVDEIHVIAEQHRGYILEIMLSKLRYFAKNQVQIVGMSATLPNVRFLGAWLGASVYECSYRPVPLMEYICCNSHVCIKPASSSHQPKWEDFTNEIMLPTVAGNYSNSDGDGDTADCLKELLEKIRQLIQSNPLKQLSNTVILDTMSCSFLPLFRGHSVLVFCRSKIDAQQSSSVASDLLIQLFNNNPSTLLALIHNKTTGKSNVTSRAGDQVLIALSQCPDGLNNFLAHTIPWGIAFHHAGLSIEERRIIETAYKNGTIKLLFATSTLAAGVNLPARRVIFKTPYIARDFIDVVRYKQMSGRAGRKGQGTIGESIIVCENSDTTKCSELLLSQMENFESTFKSKPKALQKLILDVLSNTQGCGDSQSLAALVDCSLLGNGGSSSQQEDDAESPAFTLVGEIQNQEDARTKHPELYAAMQELISQGEVRFCKMTNEYKTTTVGKGRSKSGLQPEEALAICREVNEISQNLVLASDVELLFLISPDYKSHQKQQLQSLNWALYLRLAQSLTYPFTSLSKKLRINLPYIQNCQMQNGRLSQAEFASLRFRNHSRFYVTLLLWFLLQLGDFSVLCQATGLTVGDLQQLQQEGIMQANRVATFCEHLRFTQLADIVTDLGKRLGILGRKEVEPLLQIPCLTHRQAVMLLSMGLKTPKALAKADPFLIAQVVRSEFIAAKREAFARNRVLPSLNAPLSQSKDDSLGDLVEEVAWQIVIAAQLYSDVKRSYRKAKAKLYLAKYHPGGLQNTSQSTADFVFDGNKSGEDEDTSSDFDFLLDDNNFLDTPDQEYGNTKSQLLLLGTNNSAKASPEMMRCFHTKLKQKISEEATTRKRTVPR